MEISFKKKVTINDSRLKNEIKSYKIITIDTKTS